MYKEMWDKSISDEDLLGIGQTIQINPENIPNNLVQENLGPMLQAQERIQLLLIMI